MYPLTMKILLSLSLLFSTSLILSCERELNVRVGALFSDIHEQGKESSIGDIVQVLNDNI